MKLQQHMLAGLLACTAMQMVDRQRHAFAADSPQAQMA